MGLVWYIKVLIDANIQGIDRLVLWDNKGAATAYTSNISLCFGKDTSREESSANMKIFVDLKDLHAELPSLTMLDFFLSVSSMTRFGTCPVIHMQSTNMVKVRTAITRMQTYYKAHDPKCLLFRERRMQKTYINAMDIILIMNKIRTIFK